MNEVFVCRCVPEENHDAWEIICDSQEIANRQACHEILAWINEQWYQYKKEEVKELVHAINIKNYEKVLDLWGMMSSFSVTVEGRKVLDFVKVPSIEDPF